MIAIPQRPGRFPIKVTSVTFPQINWVAKDSVAEGISFSGDNAEADHARALKELRAGELLVSAVDDMTDPNGATGEHYLVGLNPEGLEGGAA